MAIALGQAAALFTTSTDDLVAPSGNESNEITSLAGGDNLIVCVWSMHKSVVTDDLAANIDDITYGDIGETDHGSRSPMTVAVIEEHTGKRTAQVIAWIKGQSADGTVLTNVNLGMRGTVLDVFELTGVDQTTPVPQTNSLQNASGSPIDIGLTVGQANNWIICGAATRGNGSTIGVTNADASIKIGESGGSASSDVKHASAREAVDSIREEKISFTVSSNGRVFTCIEVKAAAAGTTFFKTISVTRTRAFVLASAFIQVMNIAVTRTRAAALSTVLTQAITIAVTRTRTAALIKKAQKTFAVTRTRAAALATVFIQPITIAVTRTRTVVVSPALMFLKAIAVTRTRTAALTKLAQKTFALTRTRTFAITKQTSKTFATTRTRSAVTTKKTLLTFAVTRTRSVVVAGALLALKAVAVTSTRSAVVSPIPIFGKVVSVTRTRTAALTKLIKKTLAVTRTRTAVLVKKTLKTLTVTRTRSAVVAAVLLAVQVVTVTRTRAVSVATVFIAGSPVTSTFLHVWRQTKMWWKGGFQ